VQGTLNRDEFEQWIMSSCKGFNLIQNHQVRHILDTLHDYVAKQQAAAKLFTMWDVDGSGTLETAEICKILDWFHENVDDKDEVFESIWNETHDADDDTAGGEIASAEIQVKVEGTGSPKGGESTTATKEASRKAENAPPETFGSWTQSLSRSLSTETAADEAGGDGAPTQTLDVEGFKKWMLRVAGHLPPKVFAKAMVKLGDAVNKQVSAKRLFNLWDKDGSGSLDLREIREVLEWFRSHTPENGLQFATMWDALKLNAEGKVDMPGFEEWMLEITKPLQPDAFAHLMAALKEHLNQADKSAIATAMNLNA